MNRQKRNIGKLYCVVWSMTNENGILIKNIYYMLTYAFRVLRQSNYEDIASEEFDYIEDLFAEILAAGIGQQLKQGLYREYITDAESISGMRGKLDIHGTIGNRIQHRKKLFCEFDDFSVNNRFNQILKTTAVILLRQPNVKPKRRAALKKVLLFFDEVDVVLPAAIRWDALHFQRNNQSYQMLIGICYFVLTGLLLTTESGQYKLAEFLDEQRMSRLFEKFVLEYYRYHYPQLKAAASWIPWNLDAGEDKFLPKMHTDIMLQNGDRVLIIDTKFYARTMKEWSDSDKRKLYSEHLYQIFAYVKNKDVGNSGKVEGMVLYAKTQEQVVPDCVYVMGGNKISAKTLDLNMRFSDIEIQLNNIVKGMVLV